jgi:hypothetical protein
VAVVVVVALPEVDQHQMEVGPDQQAPAPLEQQTQVAAAVAAQVPK